MDIKKAITRSDGEKGGHGHRTGRITHKSMPKVQTNPQGSGKLVDEQSGGRNRRRKPKRKGEERAKSQYEK